MQEISGTTARMTRLSAVLLLAIGLGGCVTGGVRSHYDHHGYGASYDYYYYPTLAVYVDLRDGHYWHRDHDRWHRVKRLPPHYRLHEQPRVLLHLDTEHPYREHSRHRARHAGHSEQHDPYRAHRGGQRGERAPVVSQSRHRDAPRREGPRDSERRKLRQTREDRERRPDSDRATRRPRTASTADKRQRPSAQHDARPRPRVQLERRAKSTTRHDARPGHAERPAAREPARRSNSLAARERDTRRRPRDQAGRQKAVTQRQQPGETRGARSEREPGRGDARWHSLRQHRSPPDRHRHARGLGGDD